MTHLRRACVIAMLGACHPTPAPTVVHAAPPTVAAPVSQAAPVRQDFELSVELLPGPLHEVLATGHECRQPPTSPIDDTPVPIDGRRLIITATPTACARHRDGRPVLR
jgi:hypothetical protein